MDLSLSLSLKKLLKRTYFSWDWVVNPMPYPQPGGPGYPFFSGPSHLTYLTWEALPVAMLLPAYLRII